MINENQCENEILYTFLKLNDEFPKLSKILTAIDQSNSIDIKSIDLKKLVPYFEELEQQIKFYRQTERGHKLSNLLKFKVDEFDGFPITDYPNNKEMQGILLPSEGSPSKELGKIKEL